MFLRKFEEVPLLDPRDDLMSGRISFSLLLLRGSGVRCWGFDGVVVCIGFGETRWSWGLAMFLDWTWDLDGIMDLFIELWVDLEILALFGFFGILDWVRDGLDGIGKRWGKNGF